MRGRTFLNKFVIIDEAQNLTPKQMKTLITRAGPGTKIVCLGNLAQIDTPYLTEGSSGLTFAVDRFKGWPHSRPRDAGARRALAAGRLRLRSAVAALQLRPCCRAAALSKNAFELRLAPEEVAHQLVGGTLASRCASTVLPVAHADHRVEPVGVERGAQVQRPPPGSTGSRSSRRHSRRPRARSRPGTCVPGTWPSGVAPSMRAHSAIGSGASAPCSARS